MKTKTRNTKMKKETRGRKSNRGIKNMSSPVMMVARAPKKMVKNATRVADKIGNRVDADMIAKGAAMMAVAAGMVATGAMLSQEKNRKKIGKIAQGGMRSFGEMMSDLSEEARDHYPAIAHQIRKEKTGKKRASSKKR